MPLTIGQVLQNRYRIDALLGQGGMGAVYRAADLALSRRCAVKELVPPAGLSPAAVAQLRQQFRQEASVLANLLHPGLPRVTDYFSTSVGEFLVMDYVEGESLDRVVARAGGMGLDPARVLPWADQLLDALAYCHSRGIIHRDIKPANIIITHEDRAILVDFGLLKRLDPSNPSTVTIVRGMGTATYAPPEQFGTGAAHTDARSDLYSLGATLYHALTGGAPASAPERVANPACLLPPRSRNQGLSPHLEMVVVRAMSMDQGQRYQAAAEMRVALLGAVPTVRISRPAQAVVTPPPPVPDPAAFMPPVPTPTQVSPRPAASARRIWWLAAACAALLLMVTCFFLGRGRLWRQDSPATATLPASTAGTYTPVPAHTVPPSAAATTAPVPTAPPSPQPPTGLPHSTSTLVPPPTFTPTSVSTVLPGRGQGRIAFVSNRDGNSEIYVMQADGTGERRLTHSSGDDWSPAWSPDGRSIAFTSTRDATVAGMHNVYLMDGQGGNVARLTANQAWDEYPAWSPDGRRLAFVTTADGNAEIFLLDLDGGAPKRLTHNLAEDRSPTWSPDGRYIAFARMTGGQWQIFVMGSDGVTLRQLTYGSSGAWHPDWSPDGSQIAFVSDLSGSSDIYRMAADGSQQVRLTTGDAEDDHPAWSPDGTAIAFWSGRQGGNHDVYVMWSDGTAQTRLTTHAADDGAPAWGP